MQCFIADGYWRHLNFYRCSAEMIHQAKYASAGRLMLITKALNPTPAGGRDMLCKLNRDALQALYADRIVVFELPLCALQSFRARVNAFRGHIDGLNSENIDRAITTIREAQIRQVFVDGSNLGGFVAVLKRQIPDVEVTTFFHNVEARFFWGSWLLLKTLHAFGVLVANTLAERKSVKFSDKIVCLNDRDSRLLRRLYRRGATHIAPMVLEDKLSRVFSQIMRQTPEDFVLFVGGTFYANKAGIEWFVREVSPRIDLPVCIVGRGFESMRTELEVPGKVVVVGAVDSLADWYHRAKFVIAPIFDGSGMKTKVAEALMYGKKIVGTSEAFAGYEDIVNQAGWLCETADDFVASITEAQAEIRQSFDPVLREIYERHYSMEAGRKRLSAILGND